MSKKCVMYGLESRESIISDDELLIEFDKTVQRIAALRRMTSVVSSVDNNNVSK